MNTILWCALGLDADAHHNFESDNFVKYGSVLFDGIRSQSWLQDLGCQIWTHFPAVHPYFQVWPPVFKKMWVMMRDLLDLRWVCITAEQWN